MTMSFKQALARQDELRHSIIGASKNLEKLDVRNFSRPSLNIRIDVLKKNWEEFKDNHQYISAMRSADSENKYFRSRMYNKTQEEFIKSLSKHVQYLPSLSADTALPTTVVAASSIAATGKQILRINLPQFSGKFTDWADFRDQFESMVKSDSSLTDIQCLNYLKTSMTGDAAQLLENLPTIGANFNEAWTILTSRYDNKRQFVSLHLDALTSLRALTTESSSELKRLIDGTTSSREALEQLQRPVKNWNDLLVHLTVQKMDSVTHCEWKTLIEDKTEFPTFRELEAFFNKRINTLQTPGSRRNSLRSFSSSGLRQLTECYDVSSRRPLLEEDLPTLLIEPLHLEL